METTATTTTFDPFKLLDVDIRKLPRENFILEEDEKDEYVHIQTYKYAKPLTVMKMFENLTYMLVNAGAMENYSLSAHLLQAKELNMFLDFIDGCATALGKDENGLGAFDMAEIEKLKAQGWIGRKWKSEKLDVEIKQSAVTIYIYIRVSN